jgi:hypothetical protein
MTDTDSKFDEPAPGIDASIRAHLDAEASRVDSQVLWAGVLARLESDSPNRSAATPRSPRKRWLMAATSGLAAAALVAVALLVMSPAAVATPTQVVASARAELAASSDLCYRMTVDYPPEAKDVLPIGARHLGPQHVWTRGGQFVVEPGLTEKGAWGRDAHGRVWAAPSRDAAASFEAEELPRKLRNLVAVFGLELRPLLDEVLADFELSWSDRAEGVYRILATRVSPKGPFRVSAVTLVIDKQTKRILSLTVTRSLPDGQDAHLHLDLVDEKPQPDAIYTAEGHINRGVPVFDRSTPKERRRFLLQFVGEILTGDH